MSNYPLNYISTHISRKQFCNLAILIAFFLWISVFEPVYPILEAENKTAQLRAPYKLLARIFGSGHIAETGTGCLLDAATASH